MKSPQFFLCLFLISLFSCGAKEDETPNIEINTSYEPVYSFQWVLNTAVDPASTPYFDFIDIDGFDNSKETVAALHAKGMTVIAYISVGSWEDWRDDAADFPEEILGEDYYGWAGEKWLDISNLDQLGPILEARLDMLVEKGFDGVEPDNLDGYETATGFDLSAEDAETFCKWLTTEAHERGLSIGQKNIPEFTETLIEDFDWVLTEDAFAQGWEADVVAYRAADKPVFMVEYTDENINYNKACQRAKELDYTLLIKERELGVWYENCLAE